VATVTVRQLDHDTKTRLRIRAARNGHSMEQEARDILRTALAASEPSSENWVDSLTLRLAAIGGDGELPVPARTEMAEPISFGE